MHQSKKAQRLERRNPIKILSTYILSWYNDKYYDHKKVQQETKENKATRKFSFFSFHSLHCKAWNLTGKIASVVSDKHTNTVTEWKGWDFQWTDSKGTKRNFGGD